MRLGRKISIAFAKLRQLGLSGVLALRRDRRTIAESPLFDAEWYLANNSDVAANGVDPALHYLLFGVSGNRSPSTGFVTDEYLALNGDVRRSGMNPLLHYERFGRREGRPASFLGGAPRKVTYAEQQGSFRARRARAAAKLEAGERLRSVFLVSNASMFPARPLFDAMLASDEFDPRVVVVPDVRWRDGAVLSEMASCREALAAEIPADRLSAAEQDVDGVWRDVLEDADVVCYPSPYEMSSFRYNPRYSVGRQFLPVMVNYGFYRSAYDRGVMCRQSYAWMWKAFFECGDTMDEYRAASPIGGANGDLAGYVKMDALAACGHPVSARRRVLVALHHSVEGGTNDELALSNFARYADFLLALPDRYPEIDFVFRPHPFLMRVLSRPGQWGVERVERYFSALRSKPNVAWSGEGGYFREFAMSDACIQDCGSFLVEYLYTRKPCCYMLKSPGDAEAKFAPLGRKCLGCCYLAFDEEAIERFLDDVVVAGKDPKRAEREALADAVALNYPHAASVALGHILDGIRRGGEGETK